MSKNFIRIKEDFFCEQCGFFVKGGGYTNHCSKCFWSKHVDKNPGDREEDCAGMMKPVGLIHKKDRYIIVHKCLKCGFEKNNKASVDDDISALIETVSGMSGSKHS